MSCTVFSSSSVMRLAKTMLKEGHKVLWGYNGSTGGRLTVTRVSVRPSFASIPRLDCQRTEAQFVCAPSCPRDCMPLPPTRDGDAENQLTMTLRQIERHHHGHRDAGSTKMEL